MSIKLVAAVIILALGGVVLFTGLGSSGEAHAQVPPPGEVKFMTGVIEGNYRVHYECAYPDNTKKQDKEEQVRRIEFHPEYIVLINQTGSGRIIPVHSIKQLRWEQS